MFKTILFPIDQSKSSLEAINKVMELAANHKSSLMLLSVHATGVLEKTNIDQFLLKIKEQITNAGIPCEILQKEGQAAFVICDEADERNIDLIVMGTKGVNLRQDTESTAAKVIQLAPCPVLVVP